MARLTSGILSAPRGAVASVVGASWKGISYIRERVTPANPKTAAQQSVRSIFALVSQTLKAFLDITARPLVNAVVTKQSGYNRLVGRSAKIMGDTFDGARLAVCDGPTAPLAPSSIAEGTGESTVSFADTAPGDPTGTDTVYGVAVDRATGALLGDVESGPRSVGSLSVPHPDGLDADAYAIHLWATREDEGGATFGSQSVSVSRDAAGANMAVYRVWSGGDNGPPNSGELTSLL